MNNYDLLICFVEANVQSQLFTLVEQVVPDYKCITIRDLLILDMKLNVTQSVDEGNMLDAIVNVRVESYALIIINDEDESETTPHLSYVKEQLAAIARVKYIVNKHYGEDGNFFKFLSLQGELHINHMQSMQQTRIDQFFQSNRK